MKKFVLILAALLFAAPLALAQGYWEAHFGVSSSVYDRSYGRSEICRKDNSDNDNYRSQYTPTTLPTLTLSGGYTFDEVPFGFFLDLGWNYAWNNLEGGPSLLRENEHIFHLTPNVRLYYLRHPKFRMYADVGVDFRLRHFAAE